MEFVIEVSDDLLSNYGNISLIDSFDIFSLCSDVFTDDLELNALFDGRISEIGEDYVKMVIIYLDEGFVSKSGLYRKAKK